VDDPDRVRLCELLAFPGDPAFLADLGLAVRPLLLELAITALVLGFEPPA
jgi:hypothetical protein